MKDFHWNKIIDNKKNLYFEEKIAADKSNPKEYWNL